MISYARIGILAGLFVFGLFLGWYIEHGRFITYKTEVEAAVKAQEAHVESIKAQQALITKAKEDEYSKSLTLIRAYYANGMHSNGSSPMQSLSLTSTIADAAAKYNLLASDCAATTQQVIELQSWINEQIGIK